MKTAFAAIAVALMISSTAHAAEAPVRIGLEQYTNPAYPALNLHEQRIHIQSLTDKITLNDVVVNRGNCRIRKMPAVYMGSKPVPLVPSILVYGKEVAIRIDGPCNVAEINVITDQGSWVMKY